VDGVAPKFTPPSAPKTIELSEAELATYAGIWRNEKTHSPIKLIIKDGKLLAVGGGPLQPIKPGIFIAARGSIQLEFENDGSGNPTAATMTRGDNIHRYVPVPEWKPTDKELREFEGEWFSEEAGASFIFSVKNSKLIASQRPDTKLRYTARFKDHFTLGMGQQPVIWFTRDAAGKVTTLHFGASRMRNMPFVRRK
jgi:hypothetical protein